MSRARETLDVDRWTAVAAASTLVGINQLIINIQPLLLGALARHDGLTDAQLGLISSALIGGASIASLTGPFWVRRVNWRFATWIFLLAATAALLAMPQVRGFGWLCAAFVGIGLLKGGIGAPSFVSLGDTSNPERNFGTSVAVQAGLAAIVAAPVAALLIPAYGPVGVYYSLAGALGIGVLAVFFLPSRGRPQEAAQTRGRIVLSPALLPFLVVMLAMILFTIGVTGFWFFLERIGASKGVPATTIGLAVSGTALVTIPGSFAVTWLSRWLSGLRFTILGSLLIAIGYGLVALPSSPTFLAGSLVFAFGWGVCQPGYWALARETDPTSRLFVLSGAVSGLASVITGFLAGPVIAGVGYDGLIVLCGIAILGGMALCVAAKSIAAAALTGAAR